MNESEAGPAWADELMQLSTAEPGKAQAQAHARLQTARAGSDPAGMSVAMRALGLMARERNEPVVAISLLEESVRLADAAGFSRVAADSRVTLALTLFYAGQTSEALAEIAHALTALPEKEGARARLHRGLLLQRMGLLDEALVDLDDALPMLQLAGDRLWEARLLNNRGLLFMQQGEFRQAADDLLRAEDLYAGLGQGVLALQATHNRACVASLEGRFPAALELFHRAEIGLTALECSITLGLQDHCTALLAVNLIDEALSVAQRAVRELSAGDMRVDLAEAQLLLCRAAFAAEDFGRAASAASAAEVAFANQNRPLWCLLARHQRLQAVWSGGGRSAALVDEAAELASEFAANGWATAIRDVHVTVARMSLDLGQLDRARAALNLANSAPVPSHALGRVHLWHAEALWNLQSGHTRMAARALRSGLATVEQHRAALGATELRAQAAGQAKDLAMMGVRLACERGGPREIFRWSERWRAGALLSPPATPPDDAEMAAELAELRTVAQERRAISDPSADIALDRRQAALEQSIRHRARMAPGRQSASIVHPLQMKDLVIALRDRVLIEFVTIDDDLVALVLADGRMTRHSLGSVTIVERALTLLRFSLRRMSDDVIGSASAEAAGNATVFYARQLDVLLLQPMRRRISDRDLVLVPTGNLLAMPWALLSVAAGRAVSVVPSAALWLRASANCAPKLNNKSHNVVLAAGPDLAAASTECSEIARQFYPDGALLSGGGATAEAVLSAMDGSRLVHVAAHARFRSDNPMFSSLGFADGPLTVFDLESLGRAPAQLVLAACQSGLSTVHPGDELMGLTAALLRLGTTAIVASVVDINDAATAPLMLDLHRGLIEGAGIAGALATAQQAARDGSLAEHATAASFVCFGAG